MLSAAQRIQSSLLKCAAVGQNAVSTASRVVSLWRDMDAALAPIIGHRGVAALFGRSLDLAHTDHPWLTTSHAILAEAINFEALHSTLSQHSSTNVIAANGALLQKFFEQLTKLLGVSLTEQLLRAVVDVHSTGDAT